MAFDPFGDHSSRGYLRNHAGETDVEEVKFLEHAAVKRGIRKAVADLSHGKPLTYQDVLKTHETLFKDLYPWAGKDRLSVGRYEAVQTGDPSKRDIGGIVTKGPVTFMPSSHAEQGMNYALSQGNDPKTMRESPGSVMGNMAYAHPFLDGNGRTLMAIHGELAARAGYHIDWSQTNKADYLNALTQEISQANGQLDAYLKPFMREGALTREERLQVIETLPGLSAPGSDRSPTLTVVGGPKEAGIDKLLEKRYLGSLPDERSDPEAQAKALSEKSSFTVRSELSDSNDLAIMDKVREAGFRVELKFISKDGLGDPMRQSLKHLPEAMEKADHVQVIDNSGPAPREMGQGAPDDMKLNDPKPWAVDAAIDQVSKKLVSENDLALKSRHVDQLIELARAGGDSHQGVVETGEQLKASLADAQAPKRDIKTQSRPNRPGRNDDGHGL